MMSMHGWATKRGRAPVERGCALGQRRQRIQGGQGAGDAAQCAQVALQGIEHLLEQQFLSGQCTLLGRQGFVFEGLQFGRDEAFCVLQGLSALVVRRYFVPVALCHLDVEAMHLVELHPQVGNAGALALSGFQVQQEGVAVLADGAQFVQLGVHPGRDHAAVAQQRGGFQGHGTEDAAQGFQCHGRVEGTSHLLQQRAVCRHPCRQRGAGFAGCCADPPAHAGAPGAKPRAR